MFICKSSSPLNWTVNGATVTVTRNNKLDGHDEVSVIVNSKALLFNRCINNTKYGCDDDKDFHDSVIVYCKGLFLCIIVCLFM